jgi:hypothetical protein
VIVPGGVISYLDMCREEGINLQRGMNYRSGGRPSVILMSQRRGAPYDDRVEQNGRVLIYEGHDTPQTRGARIRRRSTSRNAVQAASSHKTDCFYKLHAVIGKGVHELNTCVCTRRCVLAFGLSTAPSAY